MRLSWDRKSVLLTHKIVSFFAKSSDQRERIGANRAAARIGWQPCRPVRSPTGYKTGCCGSLRNLRRLHKIRTRLESVLGPASSILSVHCPGWIAIRRGCLLPLLKYNTLVLFGVAMGRFACEPLRVLTIEDGKPSGGAEATRVYGGKVVRLRQCRFYISALPQRNRHSGCSARTSRMIDSSG